MNKRTNQSHRFLSPIWAIFLCACILLAVLLPLRVSAATVSGHSVSGLTVSYVDKSYNTSSKPAAAWTATNNTLKWSGKTDRSGLYIPFVSNYTFYWRGTELTLSNNSGSKKLLSFDYSVSQNGGSVKLMGADGTAKELDGNGSYSACLENGEAVTITTQTSRTVRNKTLTVTLSNISLAANDVTITFNAPDSAKGTYKVNGTAITANTQMTNSSATTYALEATPLANYVFKGWYLNGNLISEASKLPAAILASAGTVTAEFMEDPLYTATTATGDYSKDQLVEINTQYHHESRNDLGIGQSAALTNCFYSVNANTGIQDDWDMQYVPFFRWTTTAGGVMVSGNGTVEGEWCTSTSNSYVRANMVSNVIRIYAKEDCNISFSYTNSCSISGSWDPKTIESYLRLYESSSGNESFSTVYNKGTQYKDTNPTEPITIDYTLGKGQYLYIYTSGSITASQLALPETGASGYASGDYKYSATISGFTVSYNDVQYTQSTTFQDNLGNPLAGGKLTIGTTTYPVESDGSVSELKFSAGQTMLLSVTAPNNYKLLGWEVDGELYCQATYEYVLTKDTTAHPIFVPNEVTFNGDTGLYQYKNISGAWVDLNGQYIARNEDATDFYTSLSEGFTRTDVVVLLGNMTISGSFEIPSTETLVVPYDIKAVPTGGIPTAIVAASLRNYATLTISGNTTVKGKLMVSGHQNWSNGSPTGMFGTLTVTGSINVEDGGILYGYGLTNGTGTIYAKDGAQVHELVEILDMRHPATTKALVDDAGKYKIFPFNIFYFNSIETKVVYSVGATLEGHYSLHYDETTQGSAKIIGSSDAIFLLQEGTVSKYYDRSTGKIVFRVNEGSKAESGIFATEMKVKFSGTSYNASIDSSQFILPLCSGYHIQVAGDFTLNHQYKLLPGAKMEVTRTGKLTISEAGCLILYRLNDYDYRKFDANKDNTEAIGFGVQAYPVNMSRAAVKFTLANVGSATMHVDGTVIAYGGLYVTDQIITEQDGGTNADGVALTHKAYTHYDNGYNNLTGTGVITIKVNSESSIYENLNTSADRNIHAVTVKVIPIMGLRASAETDSQDEYDSLSGVMYGFINEWDVNAWTDDPCVAGRHTDANTDGLCDSCGTLVFYATNVSLGNNLDLLFAFSQTAADTKGASYVIFTHNGVSKQVDIADWQTATIGNGSYYVVSYGFAAKEMCDYVTVVIYNSDDKPISVSKTDSIRDYAMRMLGKLASAEDEPSIYLRCVIVDMLYYGAACQEHFNYKENDLATDGLTDAQKKYATPTDPSLSDTTRENASFWAGANLVAESNIQFAVAFKGLSAGAKVEYSFTGHKGNSVSGEVTLDNMTESNGVYYFVVPELVVADARCEITIKVTSGNTTQTWTESVEAYVARNATNDESGVFMAFMKFADSAKIYLHHKYNQEG